MNELQRIMNVSTTSPLLIGIGAECMSYNLYRFAIRVVYERNVIVEKMSCIHSKTEPSILEK